MGTLPSQNGRPGSDSLQAIRRALKHARKPGENKDVLSDVSVTVADGLLRSSRHLATAREATRTRMLAGMMGDRPGQLFSTLLTDRVPRLKRGRDIVRQAAWVLRITGIPLSMRGWERLLLWGLPWAGKIFPWFAGLAIRRRIAAEARPFLIPGEASNLRRRLKAMRLEGVSVNVNQLGEEVLGHVEAERHMKAYLKLLAMPEVDTISIKISSICAQLDPLAWEDSHERLCSALIRLYRAAQSRGPDAVPLIMLDMEATRDLELTYRSFIKVLSNPEFSKFRAGIVLQAYLPDSHAIQEALITWSKARVEAGGLPIQMRIVKGANLAMEAIESNHHGWALPMFSSKVEVDASFKTMVERACLRETLDAVRLGVASHNLFDIAYTLTLLASRDIEHGVHFEVLRGMAGGLARTLMTLGCDVLIYSPSVDPGHLHSAVAYLVRRMDENTDEANFLRHSFGMEPGDNAWDGQRDAFLESRRVQGNLDFSPRRQARPAGGTANAGGGNFANDPETDFTIPANRTWMEDFLRREYASAPRTLPLHLGGRTLSRSGTLGFDPSRPGWATYDVSLATHEDVQEALGTAVEAQTRWSQRPVEERAGILVAVAALLRARRGELIACLVRDGGKAVRDADAEVSEAIDFAEYYAVSVRDLDAHPEVRHKPRGVFVVTPPWNFPLAIPLGGVFAALVTGNSVILKPAIETPLIALRAVECCYEAGVPRDVLQYVVATDDVATPLITDERVNGVVLTGGTATARLFKRLRPALYLLAETGGKNATIVSRFADYDAAVESIVESAFAHSGQKCSATSLLIVTRELAEDPRFTGPLIDAARSMRVGSAWDMASRITPLIHPPEGHLLRGLTELSEGETWWLKPAASAENPRLWTPGIKAGVKPGSYAHLQEFFGPLLSVMVAADLEEAIAYANATPYGLTAGFHSLDAREVEVFMAQMDAGNLYVNRTTTGAVVERQPFGGRKASSFGPGCKAGGPNYIGQFVHLTDKAFVPRSGIECSTALRSLLEACQAASPENECLLEAAARSYARAQDEHFGRTHDPAGLMGQDNTFRYQAHARVLIVLFPEGSLCEFLLACLAARAVGVAVEVAVAPGSAWSHATLEAHMGGVSRVHPHWAGVLSEGGITRVRAIGQVSSEAHLTAAPHVAIIDSAPVLQSGRFECGRYLLEQSISNNYHRYGHLGPRALNRGVPQ